MAVNLTIPTTWNQLSQTQLQNIVHQMQAFQEIVKDTPASLATASSKLFTQIAKELLRGNEKEYIKIALEEITPQGYAPYTKFIYDGVERTKFIPSVRIGRTTYYGPDIRYRNATIAEFAFVDAAFYKWRQTSEPMWLNVLCASLYRESAPQPTEIDIRKPFVKGKSVDDRADIFVKLNYKTKLAIAYTYEGCRNRIAKQYPNVFPAPVIDETDPKPLPKQKYISFGAIIHDKIEGDPSKLELTNNVLATDFLSIYEKDILDMRKKK